MSHQTLAKEKAQLPLRMGGEIEPQDGWTMIERDEADGSPQSPADDCVPEAPEQSDLELEADRILEAVAARNLYDSEEDQAQSPVAGFDSVPRIFYDLMTGQIQIDEAIVEEEDRIAQALASLFLELGALTAPLLAWVKAGGPVRDSLECASLSLSSIGSLTKQAAVMALTSTKKATRDVTLALKRVSMDEEGRPTWFLVSFLGGLAFVSASVAIRMHATHDNTTCPR